MKHVKLFEEFSNKELIDRTSISEANISSDAIRKLADEIHGELYTAKLKGNSATVKATTTTQTWDDGVPVLKYLARGKAKSTKFEPANSNVMIVHDYAHGWFYFTDFRKWYGLHQEDGYSEIEDLPFVDVKVTESKVNEKKDELFTAYIEDKRKPGGSDKDIMDDYGLQVKNRDRNGFDVVGYKADIEAFAADYSIVLDEITLAESKVNDTKHRNVNEAARLDRDSMMSLLLDKYGFKTVRTTEEFNGNVGGIWVSGENGETLGGKKIYNYYGEGSAYELGVLKKFEQQIQKNGWYSEWYDAGTVMIWPL